MHKRTKGLLGAVATAAGLTLLAWAPAMAQQDVFKVSYFDVATSAAPSRAGYGGAGISGGAGDNTVRIVNPTAGANSQFQGTLCAMIYVFDDFEEMQTCCGCPVTPDGLRTLSTINDLTFDFGVNKANLNAGVIEIVSSQPNFFNPNPPPAPNPPGTNLFCSPTGAASNDPFGRATAVTPTPALRAWITHDEVAEPGNIPAGKVVQSASVEEFQDAPLDGTHLWNLQQRCAFLIQNGSGAGVCTCGFGDSFPGVGKTAGR
jgi:hypothetical protein